MKAWLRGVTMGNYLMPRRAGSLYESSEVNSRYVTLMVCSPGGDSIKYL